MLQVPYSSQAVHWPFIIDWGLCVSHWLTYIYSFFIIIQKNWFAKTIDRFCKKRLLQIRWLFLMSLVVGDARIGIDIIHDVVTAGFCELHYFWKHPMMEYSTLYASLIMLLCCYFVLIVLNLMACSKIGFDLFPVGDWAIPRYIDSIERDLPLPII